MINIVTITVNAFSLYLLHGIQERQVKLKKSMESHGLYSTPPEKVWHEEFELCPDPDQTHEGISAYRDCKDIEKEQAEKKAREERGRA